ncbi:MAG TPA: ABC transporter ATP-binding protein [Pseudolabrys sp.]|nr:ABC transporter ATP-binding protein [Pseudolabrys sp.]
MSAAQGHLVLSGIAKSYGAFAALKGIDLEIRNQEFFALLGPSGSGKTTTLRVIAGLETPDAGSFHLDGVDVSRASPAQRNVAMVFQNYALYPHMTVAENIGFPLKMERLAKAEIAVLVRQAAQRVKIDHLLDRRPGQLSGGQQQRCALARAVVRKPRLFLLDEPLSNLDAQLRLETRIELKRLHAALGVTTIYVTHDQEEAMTLADRMAIFRDGRIVQVGTPDEVFNTPQSIDVAGFIGSPPMNLIPARVEDGRLRVGEASIELRARGVPAGEVILGIRPSHIGLSDAGLPAKLLLSENLGESMLLNADFGGQLVKIRLPEVKHLAVGTQLHLVFDPAQIHLFDPQSRRRLGGASPNV